MPSPLASTKWERFKYRLARWGFSLAIIVIALIPTWIYLVVRLVFSPDNALTEILLFGVALYFLGAIQLVLLVLGIMLLVSFLSEV